MPKRKEPPISDAEQKRRFEALARQTGASASKKQLSDALKRIARPKERDLKRGS